MVKKLGSITPKQYYCEECGDYDTDPDHANHPEGPVWGGMFNDRRAPKKPQGGEPGLTSL